MQIKTQKQINRFRLDSESLQQFAVQQKTGQQKTDSMNTPPVFCCQQKAGRSMNTYSFLLAQFFAVQNGGALVRRKKLLRLIY